ncbi:MAG TPA: PrsW family intramembrane metalloprotease [Candidatus Eisenbacteria bacterium]|jgi:hypothetical protein
MDNLLLILAVAPSLLILWYFQASDRYPEPPHVIWTTFLLGMLVGLPVGEVEKAFLRLAGGMPAVWARGSFEAFFAAAFPEELAKFLVLTLYCARRSEFDEPMDGLVYGSAVALGFACFENVRHVLGQYGGLETALVRAVTAVPSHGADGAIMGYFLSLSRHAPRRRSEFLLLSLAVPSVFHGLYDMLVLVGDDLPRGDPAVATLWIAWLCLIGLQLWLARLLLREHVRRQEAGMQGGEILSYVRLKRRNRLRAGWAIVACGAGLIGLATLGPWFVGPLRGLRASGVVVGAIVVWTGSRRLRD